MTDTLVYNIPAWSKDIDLFADCDKPQSAMLDLLPDPYARRMSDDAVSSATTTSGPASPATEPDAAPAPLPVTNSAAASLRKPSLPGIGALAADTDSFPRRASLPTLASDLSLRSPTFPVRRAQDPALASYAFPGVDAYPQTPSSAFPSPSAYPLSAQSQYARWPEQNWEPASAPSSPKRRRTPPASTPQSAPAAVPADPNGAPPQRRRGKLPKHTTDLLKEWLHAHSDHPYPSEDEKRDLCARTKLSMSQVSNWMINARRRILAPAKNPSHPSATTSEPYRTRPIGALYPPHAHSLSPLSPHHLSPPHIPPAQYTGLRLYDPSSYSPGPGPQYPQSAYPGERRLAYPASTLDTSYGYQQQQQQQGMYMQGPHSAPADRDVPRFYASGPVL